MSTDCEMSVKRLSTPSVYHIIGVLGPLWTLLFYTIYNSNLLL